MLCPCGDVVLAALPFRSVVAIGLVEGRAQWAARTPKRFAQTLDQLDDRNRSQAAIYETHQRLPHYEDL